MAENNIKKIALIHSIFRPDTRGGAEMVVDNIAAGLRERGDDFFVIAVGRKNQVEQVDGIKVHRIKPFNFFNFLDINKKPAWLRFFWHIVDMFNDVQTLRIFKIIKSEKPDLILTHNLKGLGYYLPWLFRLMSIKHIHTVHDAQLIHPSGLVIDSAKNISWPARIYCWFCRRLFGSPNVVVFPSQYIMSLYDKYGFFKKSLKRVVANPVTLSNFSEKQRLTNSLYFRIGFVGQVEKYKGVFDLLKATKALKGCDWELWFAGEGSAFSELQKNARDDNRVKFLGRLDQAELAEKFWPAINVLVNPSRVAESFGMVVVEANSHGVPAITSNSGALPELIEEGKNGWVVSDDLSDKLLWCCQNKDKLLAMRKDCLAVAQKYGFDQYYQSLAEIAGSFDLLAK